MVTIVLLSFYVLLVGLLYLMQDGLIFPGRSSQGQPEARFHPPQGCRVVELTTKAGDRVVALYAPALSALGQPRADAVSRPTILYFYGNGQYIGGSLVHVAALRRLGVNVLMPDYVGYGLSGGRAGEEGCYATADAAYDYLVGPLGIAPERLLLGGFSLGGAVAIDLASRKPAAALIVSCTFTNMTDMAHSQHPYVPASLFLRHRFASLTKIAKVRCPTLIANGLLDPLVSPAMTRTLASAAGGKVTRITLKDAGHDDLIRVAEGKDAATIARFVEQVR